LISYKIGTLKATNAPRLKRADIAITALGPGEKLQRKVVSIFWTNRI